MIPRGRHYMIRPVTAAMTLASPETLADFVQRVPLLADMPPVERQALLPHCHLETHSAQNDIFRQGDPADRVWIIGEGKVKIIRHDEGGREGILEVISPG